MEKNMKVILAVSGKYSEDAHKSEKRDNDWQAGSYFVITYVQHTELKGIYPLVDFKSH